MVDKCAGKVCSKDAKGRERRCNPESGRCKLTTAMNVMLSKEARVAWERHLALKKNVKTAMNVKKNVKNVKNVKKKAKNVDEELVWTLVSKARRNVKGLAGGRRCATGTSSGMSGGMSEAIEKIIVKEKIDRGRLKKAFEALREKIPTLEDEDEDEDEAAANFYNHYFIHSGGDSDADYQYQVIFGGKRTFYAFVNPERTWAERMKIADEKLCIGDESDLF